MDLEAKSVKTVSQALNICTATQQNNQSRALRTADIQSMHDGAPPRSGAQNVENAKSWQSNASTNWLSGIVGRVAQRLVNAVISQVYITSSALPDSVPEAKTKTGFLRQKFTQLVRAWDGYTGLINSLAVETALQGYTYGVFLDPYTWKPVMFKQDKAFVPELSGQHARDIQFFVAKMDYRLDEFIDLFKDEKAAEEVGYEIQNCVSSANTAEVQDPRSDATTTQFRNFVDMINEGTLGLSFTNSAARVVPTWLLFNREYDGQVSFWLLGRSNGKKLRFSFKLFKSMQDVLAMFSFEPGNGCIHSSKGLGRKLANLTVMKELFRNGIIDNSRMSGLMILRCDAKDRSKFSPTVLSPFIIVDKSVEIPEQQFVANSEAYRIVDTSIDSWAEQSVGAYLPQPIGEEGEVEKTATQATIEARRDSEAADIVIRRWLDNMANMTQIQQLRVVSDDNIKLARSKYEAILADPTKDTPDLYEGTGADASVLRFLIEAMGFNISDDELRMWSKSPATIYAHVSDKVIQQGTVAAKQVFQGNPNVDQSKVDYDVLESMVGAERAKGYFIPQAPTTLLAEATRQQLTESVDMSVMLLPIPVSPRDPHIIHGATVQKLLTAMAPGLSDPNADPKVQKNAELNLNHLGEHLKYGTQMGLAKDPAFGELEKFYAGFKGQLEQVVQIKAQAEAAQAAVHQAVSQNGVPPVAPAPAAAPAPAPAPVAAPLALDQPQSVPA